jgi:hypothetical protein
MADIPRAAAVRGKTMHWTWTEGPTQGKTHEHRFHDDGTVDWREAGGSGSGGARPTPAPRPSGPERVPYAAIEVGPSVYVVSYLASSGFTLTVVLNFDTHRLVGFASGGKEWHPLGGTFQVVG